MMESVSMSVLVGLISALGLTFMAAFFMTRPIVQISRLGIGLTLALAALSALGSLGIFLELMHLQLRGALSRFMWICGWMPLVWLLLLWRIPWIFYRDSRDYFSKDPHQRLEARRRLLRNRVVRR